MKKSKNITALIVIVAMCIVWAFNIICGGGNRFWIVLTGGGKLFDYGNVGYELICRDHQFYRLITYGYFHMGILHLLANICAIWHVSNFMITHIGKGKFLLLFHIGLIVPAIGWIWVFPNDSIVGASPGIFACFGLLFNWLIINRRLVAKYRKQKGFTYLLIYMIVSNFLGVGTFLIHVFGFIVGIVLGFTMKDFSNNEIVLVEE